MTTKKHKKNKPTSRSLFEELLEALADVRAHREARMTLREHAATPKPLPNGAVRTAHG